MAIALHSIVLDDKHLRQLNAQNDFQDEFSFCYKIPFMIFFSNEKKMALTGLSLYFAYLTINFTSMQEKFDEVDVLIVLGLRCLATHPVSGID